MAYVKTEWKNREVERPRTFKQTNNPDGTVTLIPEEGQIIEPGTPIIADNMNKIEDAIEELFTSVSSGKKVVADAITDKGVPTSATDPFQQMADNISNITTGEDTSDATATAGDILAGQTAYARGVKITGTRVRRTGNVNAQSISRSGTTLRLRPQAGDYDGGTGNSVQITHPTITPENIKAGVNFAGSGLVGTLQPAPSDLLYWKGLEQTSFVIGYQYLRGEQSKQSDHLLLRVYGETERRGAERTYVTDVPIDLTNVGYIYLDSDRPGSYTSNAERSLCISTSKTGDSEVYDARSLTSGYGRLNQTVDVRSLSGEFYIRVHLRMAILAAESVYYDLKIYRIFLM